MFLKIIILIFINSNHGLHDCNESLSIFIVLNISLLRIIIFTFRIIILRSYITFVYTIL